MASGPSGGVGSLLVDELVDYRHSRRAGDQGRVVDVPYLFLSFTFLGKSEQVSGVEEVENGGNW